MLLQLDYKYRKRRWWGKLVLGAASNRHVSKARMRMSAGP